MTAEVALAWIAKLGAGSVAICALEALIEHDSHSDQGLLGWPVSQTRHPFLLSHPVGRAVGLLLAYEATMVLYAGRLAGALALPWLTLNSGWHAAVVLFIAVTAVLLSGRSSFGMDGADQMSTITFLALAVQAMVPTPAVTKAVLTFLALELALSYLVSGVAKMFGPMWRNGSAIWGILSTRSYGTPRLGLWLIWRPGVCRILTWSVILTECMFPLALVLPAPLAWGLIALGLAFHLGTAFLMGLNTFLWSFGAVYPALIWWIAH